MTQGELGFLTAEDKALLKHDSESQKLAKGDLILAEGSNPDALYVIEEGHVYVQQDGVTIAVRGPGEIIGELSFLEQRSASATAVAASEAQVDRLDITTLRRRLSAQPDFAARFYQSLAVRLSGRLRETSHMLARLRGDLASGSLHAHRAPAGQLTAPLVPPDLAEAMFKVQQDVRQVETALRDDGTTPTQAAESIDAACEQVVHLLTEYTAEDRLLKLSYADLLAFRDPVHLREGIGGYVFRESFALLMLSTTIARCYAKPHGTPEDFDTLQAIYDADPQGDGAIGPMVDSWFLKRHFCSMRRAARQVMAKRLAELATSHAGVVNMCDLASGTARVLFDAFSTDAGERIHGTCVDVDPEALRSAAAEASDLGLADRMAFVSADVAGLHSNAEMRLEPQHVIFGVGLLEYLTDDDAVGLLDWTHDHLAPGGSAVFSQVSATNPDLPLVEHVLQWQLHARDAEGLASLIGQSRFGRTPDITPLADGHALLAAVKVA